MFRLKTIVKTFFVAALLSQSTFAQDKRTAFGETSWQESSTPIRPGAPGKAPFWNGFAKRFIYAPAFDIKEFSGAAKYKFNLLSEKDGNTFSFESYTPYAPLSQVWTSVPVGNVKLTVMALNTFGQEIGVAGTRDFYRAAPFNGVYNSPVMPYNKSAMVALDTLLNETYVKYWLKNKSPDPEYLNYRYPAKIYSALVIGAVTFARLKPNSPEAKKAIDLAKIVADFMLNIRFQKGMAWENFVPTYFGDHFKGARPHMNPATNFSIMGVDAGNAFLDLYDYTKDLKYFTAAKLISDTYLKNQMSNGSWYQFSKVGTNEPIASNIVIPTAVINYFDRLKRDYKVKGLEVAAKKAVDYIMENPMKTYNWQGQFEDVAALKPYVNLSREQACDFAIYLLNNSASNSGYIKEAEDLIRFSEDQFVIWEQPIEINPKKKGEGWKSKNWIIPSVQEQYVFWNPVGRSAGIMTDTYMKAYQVTKKEIYLAKAKSLANSFTLVQQAHNGEYTTFFTKYNLPLWLNSVVYPAKVMMNLASLVNAQKTNPK